jgi:TfoX/Sxy family transcriptional regulator of competence genes
MTDADDIVAQVRAAFAGIATVREVRMFGGTGFMLNGNLVAAASKRGLLLRVGKDRQHDALSRPGARPVEMRGRVMDGYLYVDPPALMRDALPEWLQLALAFVRTLPPKAPDEKPARNPRKKGS